MRVLELVSRGAFGVSMRSWLISACAQAEVVVKDIEINRDAAKHRVGVPPHPDAPCVPNRLLAKSAP